MYNAPCYCPPHSLFKLYPAPPLCIYSIILCCCPNLQAKGSAKQSKAKDVKYFIKHTVIFRGLATPLRPPPRRCMNECAKEREQKRARERRSGGIMCVAGFIISSLLETAALVKNLAQNLTFPLLASANKCRRERERAGEAVVLSR